MEHFDNVNKVAFKDLTPEQMSCTMKAISEGNAEFYKDDKWRIIATWSVVFLNDSYRTIPKPVKKLNIPWAVLHFQWKYATLDCFGVYLWTEKPYFTKECGDDFGVILDVHSTPLFRNSSFCRLRVSRKYRRKP